MSQFLYRLGWLSAARPWPVIGSWIVIAIFVIGAGGAFGRAFEDSFAVPGLDSQQANDLVTAAGTGQAGLTAQVVVTPSDDAATFFDSAPERAALTALQQEAAALPNVLSTSDPAGALDAGPEAARAGGVSADGRVALLRIQYPTLEQLTAADLTNLKEFAAQGESDSPLRIEMGGDLFFAFEQSPVNAGEFIGLIAAAIILFLSFGSLIATLLPIGMAIFGLAVGVSAMSLLANVIDVPNWAPVLGGMIGLGVGIDYALFVVTRHRDHLARGMPVHESVARSIATAGQPVVFAGGIVVVSVLGLFVAGVPFMTGGGICLAIVVATMVAVSVTLLPAFLSLFGHAINRFGLNRQASAYSPGWTRWARHVTRHAGVYAVGVTALLLALAAPALALRVGIPDDGALPTTRTERQAYDLVADGFGPGTNGPLVVAIDIAGDPGAVDRVRERVAADVGVASVAEPTINADAGIASLVVVPATGPQEESTGQTVERLRSQVIPAALFDSPAQAYIGGQMVHFAEVGARVNERLPWFVGAVLALSFVLLMLVFRSVLVPLKAVLLNLLSIGGSYGVMVMVFQWGWGADLVGLTATVPIVSFIPMFMFAILFGLSMDYEVFLLSRVREEFVASGDNEESVVRGIASTGRVITSAALIMIAVFLAFVTGEDAGTKMFGLGLATAIFVDATLVRMVLVPATMKLLGNANWWLPGWLDRRLPIIDIEGPQAEVAEVAAVRA